MIHSIYCVLGGNLRAETKYWAMTIVTRELIWLKQLLKELKFEESS